MKLISSDGIHSSAENKTLEEMKDLMVSNFDTNTTEPSSDIHITDALNWRNQGIVIDGNSTQVQSTGKQLYDKNTYPMEQGSFNYTNNGNSSSDIRIRSPFMPISASTTYTISCKEAIGEFAVIYKQSDETTVIQGIGEDTENNYYTFTTPENASYMRFRIGNNTYPKYALQDNEIMLQTGSTATAYESYTNGLSTPTPTKPSPIVDVTGTQTVKSTAENLNRTAIYIPGYVDATNNRFMASAGTNSRSCILPCQPNTSYYIKRYGGNRFAVAESEISPIGRYSTNVNIIFSNNTSVDECIVTTTSTANYLIIYTSTLEEKVIVDILYKADANKIQNKQ